MLARGAPGWGVGVRHAPHPPRAHPAAPRAPPPAPHAPPPTPRPPPPGRARPPGGSGDEVTRAPFTRVPLVESRSTITKPSASRRISACTRDTEGERTATSFEASAP